MPLSKVETKSSSGALQGASDWHLLLFSKSVLKQAKLKRISEALGEVEGKTCLDLGSDNGVISYYLRKLGGTWSSADLTEQAVSSIRSLVAERVELCSGERLPFKDGEFDLIVVVDMLEHVEDDKRFVEELYRVAAPQARLIINAPNLKPYSALRAFRHLIGQTDEAHGHLRPGYDVKALNEILGQRFEIQETRTYSRFFSEAIDTAIVAAYSLLSLLKGSPSQKSEDEVSKGLLFTEEDMKKFEKSFRLYSKIYPLVRSVAMLDSLIPFLSGYMRLTQLRKL